jgi:hypothetical protein
MTIPRLLALVIIVTSCVTGCFQVNLAHDLDTWVGASQSDLVSQWGAPDLTADLPDSGGKVMTWIKHWTSYGVRHDCRESFTISPTGKILKWSLSGGCPD